MGLYMGKRTPAECDRCGRKVQHSELKSEVERGKVKGNKVCGECYDGDHPQNWVGMIPVSDRQSVKDARPPPNLREDRSLYGFNPVGAPGNYLIARTGKVTITIT